MPIIRRKVPIGLELYQCNYHSFYGLILKGLENLVTVKLPDQNFQLVRKNSLLQGCAKGIKTTGMFKVRFFN